MAAMKANPISTPSAELPTGRGNYVSNPAWDQVVNAHHERAHQTLARTRDQRHDAGNQVFASVTRPVDSQSY